MTESMEFYRATLKGRKNPYGLGVFLYTNTKQFCIQTQSVFVYKNISRHKRI